MEGAVRRSGRGGQLKCLTVILTDMQIEKVQRDLGQMQENGTRSGIGMENLSREVCSVLYDSMTPCLYSMTQLVDNG